MNTQEHPQLEPPRSLAEWIDTLPAEGRHTFTSGDAERAAGGTAVARRGVLARLVAQRRLASPRRGFYVIVPPEHRKTGVVPPTWYVDDMMRFLGTPYYVGLLSAAALHGAGHQQPQRLQVVTARQIRPTSPEGGRIAWIRKQTLAQTPVEQRTTPTGYLTVATTESTACDLVQYPARAGGLSNVVTVLGALAPLLDPRRLVRAADAAAGIAVVQRLGYLLELVAPESGGSACTALDSWLAGRDTWLTPLRRDRPTSGAPVAPRWKVLINDRLESDVAAEHAPGAEPQSWDEWLDETDWGEDENGEDTDLSDTKA